MTDLVEGEWLLRLPLAVEAAVDGGEAADLVHLARVVVRHADHELEEELSTDRRKKGQGFQHRVVDGQFVAALQIAVKHCVQMFPTKVVPTYRVALKQPS